MIMSSKLLFTAIFIFNVRFVSAQIFRTSAVTFNADTALVSVALHQRQYFCLMADHKLFVIDSTDKLRKVAKKVNKKISRLISLRDTLFGIGEENSLYRFDRNKFTYLRKGDISPPLYSDEYYTITASCSGEWGGSVYFTDNRSGIKYECAATCPLMINKINGSYIVTASLSHMMGFSEILRVNDPSKLLVYNRDHLKNRQIIYSGEDQSHSKKGVETLVSTSRKLVFASFLYNDELFHIVSDYKETYIAQISGNEIVPVQSIIQRRFYYPEIVVNYGGEGLLSVFHDSPRGSFMRVKGNSVKIFRFTAGHEE